MAQESDVLLLCLSAVPEAVTETSYRFEEEARTVTGYGTNAGPATALLSSLLDAGRRLDKVVLVCSETVRRPLVLKNEETRSALTALLGHDPCEGSHADFYRDTVALAAARLDSCYARQPIEFLQVDVPDEVEAHQVTAAAIRAADCVAAGDAKGVRLHIDYNGGQRYMSLMLLAISNLLGQRSVRIGRTMTVNYDRAKPVQLIQEMAPVFGCFDLVSGTGEYINYGRTGSLARYFAGSGEDIARVLSKMREFSENLQLCRTGYIMEQRGVLLALFDGYIQKYGSHGQEALTGYEQLFLYAVQDIRRGMYDLLTGRLPDIIRWCVQREFLQQALTFTSEELPGHFWASGILRASEAEMAEMDNFVRVLTTDSRFAGKKYSADRRNFKFTLAQQPSKYAYSWMVQYLPNSAGERNHFLEVTRDEPEAMRRLMRLSAADGQKHALMRDAVRDALRAELGNARGQSADFLTAGLLWHYDRQRGGRLTSCVGSRAHFVRIFKLYYLLKEQRNKTNHADDEAGVWDYGQISRALLLLVSELKKVK